MTYKNRNLYAKCLKLLDWFPAVAILGARQVGKTTLAKELGKDWTYLDLEQPQDLDRLSYDPTFLSVSNPIQSSLTKPRNILRYLKSCVV